jgi:hypothetical protein
METFKDIPGLVGFYQASNLGRIRSVDRIVLQRNNSTQKKKGKILSPATSYLGYSICALSIENKLKSYPVHRLVALAFLGLPDKNNKEINHKDGIKSNNCIDNLEWSNRIKNINHAVKNGLIKYKNGENHHNSKLSNEQRGEIIKLRKEGLTLIQLSKLFPVSIGHLCKLAKYDKS